MQTLYELIQFRSAASPMATAILGVEHQPLTYADLARHLKTTIGRLNRMGIRRNDRVAIVLPNGPGMAMSLLAVASGSSDPVPLPYRRD